MTRAAALPRVRRVAAVVAGVVMFVGACGGSDSTSTSSTSTQSVTTTTAQTIDGYVSGAVAAADAFVDTLTREQQSKATYAFDDPGRRTGWGVFPVAIAPRSGIALDDLTAEQRSKALDLMKAALSDLGFATLTQIRDSDDEFARRLASGDVAPTDVLARLNQLAQDKGTALYGAELYHIALFGAPSISEPWALQFSGHHYTEQITFHGDTVSMTPAISGLEPADDVPGRSDESPVRARVDAAFAMFDDLSDEQLDQARIDAVFRLDGPVPAFAVGPGNDGPYPETAGLAVADLTPEQRQGVVDTIAAWVNDIAPPAATALLDHYTAELDETSIAFSGSTDLATPYSYVRVDGPHVWIEVASLPPDFARPEVHVHTIYRDKTGDYGGR